MIGVQASPLLSLPVARLRSTPVFVLTFWVDSWTVFKPTEASERDR
jgi:hypothetical protein